MDAMTTTSCSVHLSLPGFEPVPIEGCDVYGALARERAEARRDGDMSKVSDLNVEMRHHQAIGRAAGASR